MKALEFLKAVEKFELYAFDGFQLTEPINYSSATDFAEGYAGCKNVTMHPDFFTGDMDFDPMATYALVWRSNADHENDTPINDFLCSADFIGEDTVNEDSMIYFFKLT